MVRHGGRHPRASRGPGRAEGKGKLAPVERMCIGPGIYKECVLYSHVNRLSQGLSLICPTPSGKESFRNRIVRVRNGLMNGALPQNIQDLVTFYCFYHLVVGDCPEFVGISRSLRAISIPGDVPGYFKWRYSLVKCSRKYPSYSF